MLMTSRTPRMTSLEGAPDIVHNGVLDRTGAFE